LFHGSVHLLISPLLKMQRSVASQDDEWQFSAAVTELKNLTDCSQPEPIV
jgi:hypothetical protein